MTTPQSTTDAAFPAFIAPFFPGALQMHRFTVDEYHRMIQTGILGENDRVELVDGWIVEMSPIGPPHMTCVSLIFAALQERLPAGWSVRMQAPITLQSGEPEPDVTIVRGDIRDYRDRHPAGSDIALVIEVADTSLEFDRLQKKLQYAATGIPEYWIVNLNEQCLEVYRDPTAGGDYRIREIVDANGSIPLTIASTNAGNLAIADLMP